MTAVAAVVPRSMSSGRAATRGSAIRLGAEAAARALSLATAVLLSVGLGVERFGIFSALSALAAIAAQLANFGVQEIACPALVSGRLSLRAMLRARAGLSAIVLALAGVAAGAGFRPAGAGVHGTAAALSLLVACAVLTGWVEFMGVALRARGRPAQEAILLVFLPGVGLAAVVLTLERGAGVGGVAAALTVAALPPLGAGALLLARTRTMPTPPAMAAPEEGQRVMAVLAASWPLALNGALALASLRIELFALALLRGPRDVGLFALALRIVEALNAASGAIAAGAFPALTREAIARVTAAARARTALLVALIAIPGASGLALLAPRLLALWGGGYEASGPVLQVLALALVPMFLNGVLLHSLIAAGHPRRLPALTAARIAVAAALAPVLAARAGAPGAAGGFVVAELTLLVLAAQACRHVGFAVPLRTAVIAGTGVAIPTALAVQLSGAGLVAPLAGGLAAYAAGLAVLWALARHPAYRRADVEYP